MRYLYYLPPADRVGPNGVKVMLAVATVAVLVWLALKVLDRFLK